MNAKESSNAQVLALDSKITYYRGSLGIGILFLHLDSLIHDIWE